MTSAPGPRPLRVMLLNSLYPPEIVGGAEQSVAELARDLSQRGHRVGVVTLGRPGSSREFTRDGTVDVFRIPLAGVVWPFGPFTEKRWQRGVRSLLEVFNPVMAYRVWTVLRRWRPDVLHTNNVAGFTGAVWPAARLLGIPIVHTTRDYYLSCVGSVRFRNGRPCERQCPRCRAVTWPRRRLFGLVSRGVGISEFIARTEARACAAPSGGWGVVPNQAGASSEVPVVVKGEVELSRLVYLGRLKPTKGLETLFEAVRILASTGGNVPVTIAGRGEEGYTSTLRRDAGDLDVDFAGYRPPGEVLTPGSILVVPSIWWEPQGRVVAEARRHGLPVVVSDSGGLAEQAHHDEAVWSFRAGDAGDLARVLSRLLGRRWTPSVPPGPDVTVAEHYLAEYQRVVDSHTLRGRARLSGAEARLA